MVTRRNFITITTMMLVLLFMFQFSGAMKEYLNDYGTNQFDAQTKTSLTSEDGWKADMSDEKQEYVILIGDSQDQAVGSVVDQWCTYTKRELQTYASLSECPELADHPPETVLLDSEHLDVDRDITRLRQYVDQGISLIFCNLPNADVVAENRQLRELLGIQAVTAKSVELTGIHLFQGFLLGGETLYTKENEGKQKRQDLELEIPWYQTLSGTKTYMVGILEDEKVKNEYLPGIIWRNSIGDARVFAVNGSYMEDSTGIGILDAMMSELHSYEIYPVVNAQNLVVANYPGLASENNEEMEKRYSQSQKAVFREIIWPGIVAVAERNNIKITSMLAPQMDYEDQNEPDGSQLPYYLKLLKEQKAETGLSGASMSNTSLEEKLDRDSSFFQEYLPDYSFVSLYMENLKKGAWESVSGQHKLLKNIRTICTEYDEDGPVISYMEDNITRQQATIDGFRHTYSEDLRVKSLETALGYSNILVDMERVAFPQSEDDTWEKLFEAFSSNTNTYWKPFQIFEQTTLAESDKRIREFFAMDYSDVRKDDKIELNIKKISQEVWFILRTHGEEIASVEGGSFEEIEEGAYLIRAEKENVEIMMKQEQELYYHE